MNIYFKNPKYFTSQLRNLLVLNETHPEIFNQEELYEYLILQAVKNLKRVDYSKN